MVSILEDVVDTIPTTTPDMLDDPLYSQSIRLYTDAALDTLQQNGVGTDKRVRDNKDLDWETFLDNNLAAIGSVRTYVSLYVQRVFDTPNQTVVTIMDKVIDESLWRARLDYDK